MPTPFTTDITAILGPGVYLLGHRDRVTYVGKARCILAALANHRAAEALPHWVPIPRIAFDTIEIIPCDTTRAIALQRALIALHNPPHNRTPRVAAQSPNAPPPTTTPQPKVRRL